MDFRSLFSLYNKYDKYIRDDLLKNKDEKVLKYLLNKFITLQKNNINNPSESIFLDSSSLADCKKYKCYLKKEELKILISVIRSYFKPFSEHSLHLKIDKPSKRYKTKLDKITEEEGGGNKPNLKSKSNLKYKSKSNLKSKSKK